MYRDEKKELRISLSFCKKTDNLLLLKQLPAIKNWRPNKSKQRYGFYSQIRFYYNTFLEWHRQRLILYVLIIFSLFWRQLWTLSKNFGLTQVSSGSLISRKECFYILRTSHPGQQSFIMLLLSLKTRESPLKKMKYFNSSHSFTATSVRTH